jgi:hypothetical protein
MQTCVAETTEIAVCVISTPEYFKWWVSTAQIMGHAAALSKDIVLQALDSCTILLTFTGSKRKCSREVHRLLTNSKFWLDAWE